jgi:hypothetical protein
MKAGRGATKTGKGDMPDPLDTISKSLLLIFFNEKALMALMLNRKHTLNVCCLYFVCLFIPFIGITGTKQPADFGTIIEGIILTFVFIGLIFLHLPKKKGVFMAAVRVILSFEIMSIFLPLTFMLDGDTLRIFHPLYLAWYLSLTVFAVSKIKGEGYLRSAILVFASFILTTLFPAFFA